MINLLQDVIILRSPSLSLYLFEVAVGEGGVGGAAGK